MKTGRVLSSIVDSVFEQNPVNDSSANTAYIYVLRKPVRTEFLLCYKIIGKRQLKHTPAAKR